MDLRLKNDFKKLQIKPKVNRLNTGLEIVMFKILMYNILQSMAE